MRDVSAHSLSATNGSNLLEGQTVKWGGYFHSHAIVNHLRSSSGSRGGKFSSVFHFIPKLREFLRLSGSLSEAVGWIRPSMEIFLDLAQNKKGAHWSISCGLLVLQTGACRLPFQMGFQGTHTNWPTEPPRHTIPSLLSQQLLYRATLQHH